MTSVQHEKENNMLYRLVIDVYLNLPALLTIATVLYIILLLIVIIKESRK